MSEKSITTFGTRLRSLREGAGLTQEELAARAGMTAKGIGALERGQRKRPYPYTVRSLADALGLTGAERETFVGVVPRRTGMAFSPTTELKGSALPPCLCRRLRWWDASGTREKWSKCCSGPGCGCSR